MSKLDQFYESMITNSYNRETLVYFKQHKNTQIYDVLLLPSFIKDLEKYKIIKFSTYQESNFNPPLFLKGKELQCLSTGNIVISTTKYNTKYTSAFTMPLCEIIREELLRLYDYLVNLKASLNNNHNLKLDL